MRTQRRENRHFLQPFTCILMIKAILVCQVLHLDVLENPNFVSGIQIPPNTMIMEYLVLVQKHAPHIATIIMVMVKMAVLSAMDFGTDLIQVWGIIIMEVVNLITELNLLKNQIYFDL